MSHLTVEPIRIATASEDEAGLLVLIDRRLAAVLSRLDAGYHGEARGRWFVEAAFGDCAVPATPPHARLGDALRWIAERTGGAADVAEAEFREIERRFDNSLAS